MGVEQQVHVSSPPNRASTAGSGASKSAAIRRMRMALAGLRRLPREASGTSRACGMPFLAMTISSPAAARSTSPDRWVLASYRVTKWGIGQLIGQVDQIEVDE